LLAAAAAAASLLPLPTACRLRCHARHAHQLQQIAHSRTKKNTHTRATAPYYVGGTAFSRNPPMPENIKIALDFGREDGHGH
jgi:hypothetical protein